MNHPQTITLCRCGATTRDHASTCEECLTTLYNLLTDDVPWLDEQLDVSIAGLRAVSLNGSSSGGSTGLLLNHRASASRRRLDKLLDQWIRFCLDHNVRNSAPNPNPPHEKAGMTERAQWLSWRIDGLAWHPSAHNARNAYQAAVNQAREVVLWKPPVRVFLGKCNLVVELEGKTVRCQGDVYALEGATGLNDEGHCRTCGQPHLVAGMREKLEAELDSRLFTAAELAVLMLRQGVVDGRSDTIRTRVRNRINQWNRRGIITPTPCAATQEDGDPRYRYGDIRARLAVEFKTDAEPA